MVSIKFHFGAKLSEPDFTFVFLTPELLIYDEIRFYTKSQKVVIANQSNFDRAKNQSENTFENEFLYRLLGTNLIICSMHTDVIE